VDRLGASQRRARLGVCRILGQVLGLVVACCSACTHEQVAGWVYGHRVIAFLLDH
jgi:hypothetical protein